MQKIKHFLKILCLLLLYTPLTSLADSKVNKDLGQSFSNQIISVGRSGVKVTWSQNHLSQSLRFTKGGKTYYSFLPQPETARLSLSATQLIQFKSSKEKYLLTTWQMGIHRQAIYIFNLEDFTSPLKFYISSAEEITFSQKENDFISITYIQSVDASDELDSTKLSQTIFWQPD